MAEEGGRTDYGIDRRAFLIAWETSNDVDEVVERLADRARAMNLPVMPKAIVVARAAYYRREGIDLKKYSPGRKPKADIDADNELVGRIRAGKCVRLTNKEYKLAELVIAEVTRRLRGVRHD